MGWLTGAVAEQIDSFVRIYETKTIGVIWLSVRFSFFRCISKCVSVRKICLLFINKGNRRKNNAYFKGKQRYNVKKIKPHPLSSVAVEISSPRKPGGGGGVKSAGGGDLE